MQQTLFGTLILHQVLFLVFTFVPFSVESVTAAILQVLFLGFFLVYEIIAIAVAKFKVPKSPLCNIYLLMRILTGLLKKASVLGSGLIGGSCLRSAQPLGKVACALSIIGIVLDQTRVIWHIAKESKIDCD